jgi:hypothetical protein
MLFTGNATCSVHPQSGGGIIPHRNEVKRILATKQKTNSITHPNYQIINMILLQEKKLNFHTNSSNTFMS